MSKAVSPLSDPEVGRQTGATFAMLLPLAWPRMQKYFVEPSSLALNRYLKSLGMSPQNNLPVC